MITLYDLIIEARGTMQCLEPEANHVDYEALRELAHKLSKMRLPIAEHCEAHRKARGIVRPTPKPDSSEYGSDLDYH